MPRWPIGPARHALEEVLMKAEDVAELYALLRDHGVQLWIDGGWGIDALLGRQTRPHKDLDAFVALADLALMAGLLSQRGFGLKEIWGENRWLPHSGVVPVIGRAAPEPEVATAFVLKHADGRELDIHILAVDAQGRATPLWECDLAFAPDALHGQGTIGGVAVRCLSAAMHMRTHSGYVLQEKDFQDLRQLHERFGVAYPADFPPGAGQRPG
jgi:lincosamide nucleotidyltransferase A/C/D/E